MWQIPNDCLMKTAAPAFVTFAKEGHWHAEAVAKAQMSHSEPHVQRLAMDVFRQLRKCETSAPLGCIVSQRRLSRGLGGTSFALLATHFGRAN